MGLLDHMVVLFLIFGGTSLLFSIVTVPIYIWGRGGLIVIDGAVFQVVSFGTWATSAGRELTFIEFPLIAKHLLIFFYSSQQPLTEAYHSPLTVEKTMVQRELVYSSGCMASRHAAEQWVATAGDWKVKPGDFPGNPVVKTPCSLCRGRGFTPWSGN